MVAPLIVGGLILGSAAVSAGANIYSQYKQRELYDYQKQGYQRMYDDWKKRNPGRTIRYPELSFPGKIRALDTGISQSYASSVGSFAGLTGSLAGGYARGYSYSHARTRSLYGGYTGRSSRYL